MLKGRKAYNLLPLKANYFKVRSTSEWPLGSCSRPWTRLFLLSDWGWKSAGCSSLPLFHPIIEATVFLWTPNALKSMHGFIPLPRSMPRHKQKVPWTSWHGLSWHTLWIVALTVTLYTQVSAFENYVQSIQFAVGGLQVQDTSNGSSDRLFQQLGGPKRLMPKGGLSIVQMAQYSEIPIVPERQPYYGESMTHPTLPMIG